MITIAMGIILAAMALMLVRLFAGPTLYDRVLAVNSFGTKTVVLLVLFAFVIDRPDAVDIAILYALINFAATIAILKFFRYRDLAAALGAQPARQTGPLGASPTPEAPTPEAGVRDADQSGDA